MNKNVAEPIFLKTFVIPNNYLKKTFYFYLLKILNL